MGHSVSLLCLKQLFFVFALLAFYPFCSRRVYGRIYVVFIFLLLAVLVHWRYYLWNRNGIFNENVYSDSLYEKYTARREALEWRLTDNDNNLGATELYEEIQEYNGTLG